jgi:glycerophosphoryl diester phosphodiesterase
MRALVLGALIVLAIVVSIVVTLVIVATGLRATPATRTAETKSAVTGGTRKERRMPRVYAHRGASRELPENTLAAFERAIELGADAIETDAWMTRDGAIVLCHDASGIRTCGVARLFAEAELDEVREWSTADGHGVPTLEQALLAFPGVRFNVDLKSRHTDAPARLVEVIRAARAQSRTLVASFDDATLARVRALGYEGETGLARNEVARLLVLPRRLLGSSMPGVAAQMPQSIFGVDLGTREIVERCHELGVEAHYWTVNDAADAARLADAGADAIMTDDPRAIVEALRAWQAAGT